MGGGGAARCIGYRDSKDEARRGSSRHAVEHGQPSLDVSKPGPIGRGRAARNARHRGSQDEVWPGPPGYIVEHGQPSLDS
jgi:hypothetical protein